MTEKRKPITDADSPRFEDDLHEKLLLAVIDYCKENERFQNSGSIRARRSARHFVKQVQQIAKDRWRQIGHEYVDQKYKIKKKP